jgi:CBS-domain-containing membrane protein
LLGGDIIPALIGISIYKYMPCDVTLLGALAVSLSIFTMHFTRTLNPPGCSTTLIDLTAGAEIHNSGYFLQYFLFWEVP